MAVRAVRSEHCVRWRFELQRPFQDPFQGREQWQQHTEAQAVLTFNTFEFAPTTFDPYSLGSKSLNSSWVYLEQTSNTIRRRSTHALVIFDMRNLKPPFGSSFINCNWSNT